MPRGDFGYENTRPPSAPAPATWLGSLTAHSAVTRTLITKTCHRHVFLALLVPCSSLGPTLYQKSSTILLDDASFLERATGKPPKRCLWQKKRGGFKEVSQWPVPERGRALADTTRAGAPKRCLWQKKRGGFKEVSQWPVPERGRALADTTRAGAETHAKLLF